MTAPQASPVTQGQAALQYEIDRIREAKARRYDWLKARLLCADFQYGDPSEACCALVFEIPDDMSVSADLDATIDDVIGKLEAA